HDLDASGVGNQPGLLDGPDGCHSDVDQLGLLQGGVDLKAGEVDDLLDQTGEPRALHLHPAGEAGHRLGVVRRLADGLGPQSQPAYRGLELVADVDDEVTPDLLDPAGRGAVIHDREHEGAAQGGHPGTDRDPATAQGPAGQAQLDLPDDAVAADLPGQMPQLVVNQVVAPDQAVRDGRGAPADNGIGCVQDDGPRTQDGEHGGHPGREGVRIGSLREMALRTL